MLGRVTVTEHYDIIVFFVIIETHDVTAGADVGGAS